MNKIHLVKLLRNIMRLLINPFLQLWDNIFGYECTMREELEIADSDTEYNSQINI